jgi:hypothetical protein
MKQLFCKLPWTIRGASFRITGTFAAVFTPVLYGAIVGTEAAGPIGTILGISIGASFGAMEVIYDDAKPAINKTINDFNNLETQLENGWLPR